MFGPLHPLGTGGSCHWLGRSGSGRCQTGQSRPSRLDEEEEEDEGEEEEEKEEEALPGASRCQSHLWGRHYGH